MPFLRKRRPQKGENEEKSGEPESKQSEQPSQYSIGGSSEDAKDGLDGPSSLLINEPSEGIVLPGEAIESDETAASSTPPPIAREEPAPPPEKKPAPSDVGETEPPQAGGPEPPPHASAPPPSSGPGEFALSLDEETQKPSPPPSTEEAPPAAAEESPAPPATDDFDFAIHKIESEEPVAIQEIEAEGALPPEKPPTPQSQAAAEPSPIAFEEPTPLETGEARAEPAEATEETKPLSAGVETEGESELFLDEILSPEEESAPAREQPAVSDEPALAGLGDQTEPASPLLETEPPGPAASTTEEPSEPAIEPIGSTQETAADAAGSLLIDEEAVTAPSTPAIEVPAKRKHKRRGERMKIVPPKSAAKVEWYANPEACATYCRKHRRPLLIYFTTGDIGECRSYEEAIRMPEMQPFLAPYVCCLANLATDQGKQAAIRLGIPTEGPAMVLLSPSGRELARVLKPEVDWQFLATMLFWALR